MAQLMMVEETFHIDQKMCRLRQRTTAHYRPGEESRFGAHKLRRLGAPPIKSLIPTSWEGRPAPLQIVGDSQD